MNKRGIEIATNLLFWIVSGWLITHGFSIQGQEVSIENGVETVRIIRDFDVVLKILMMLGLSVCMFYANLINLLRLGKGDSSQNVMLRSGLVFLVTVAIYFIIEYIQALYWVRLKFPASIIYGIFIFYFTISLAYGVVKVWQKVEAHRVQLALEKKQTELSLLRSQLHPHFLFNVLNNLLSLVDQQKNPKLATSLDQLSSLLRYVVYDTAEPSVTIKKEIEFIRNFAQLQLQRFDDGEVDFQLKVIGDCDQQEIEPGIFIPFVENAFKYGAEPEKKSQIFVSFDLSKPSMIEFEIRNPIFPALQQAERKGTGIQTTRERLELIYPGKYKLEISNDATFNVRLELKTR